MGRYILQRGFYMILTLFIIVTITFFLMQLLPGSPFNDTEKLTEEQLALMNAKYGLDKPVAVQYFTYVGNLLKVVLGLSFQHEGRTVTNIISTRVGPSVLIGFQAIILVFILGIGLDVISSLKHNTIYYYGAVVLVVIGMYIRSFVYGALMKYFVGVKLGWLAEALLKDYSHAIMPTRALSVMVIGTVARFIR